MPSKQHVSFLGNNLLHFCIIPTPSPFDVTIVPRITLSIAIILTATLHGFAESSPEPNVALNAPSTLDLDSASAFVSDQELTGEEVATDDEDKSDEGSLVAKQGHGLLALPTANSGPCACGKECVGECGQRAHHEKRLDRLWLVSTRSLSSNVCNASLNAPHFHVSNLDQCGNTSNACLDDLLTQRIDNRPVLIQVHGNRMTSDAAVDRGMFVYHNTVIHANTQPIDFIIFSWPSERTGMLLNDGREKAERTDAEGLYLAWLVRELVQRDSQVAIIGFSFGGRVATGAMHALAGGKLGGRALPGEHVRGANVSVGLIAPALEDDWLRNGQYHGLATQNIQQLSILFNRRDAVLKRYWLIDAVRGGMALGYTGPKGLAPRFDGTPMPLTSRDCSPSLGIRHDEKEYYEQSCRAGKQMAKLLQTSY